MIANQQFYASMRTNWAVQTGIGEVVLDADDDSAMPAELRNWLVNLRLLHGVPFANIVADTELLPAEELGVRGGSIRWFYLDRRWTDAIVQGALSVGTVNSDDRIQLTNNYPAIREELDDEERNVRRHAGASRRSARSGDDASGTAGPITGFLLRSSAVSGWPGLHVRAFDVDPAEGDDALFADDDPRRIRLLRLERLAPAVLLCLFDGVPKVVHIEEPRQGIQFGFEFEDTGLQRGATLRPRDVETFEYVDGEVIDVPFRVGTSGVVDIRRLAADLARVTNTDTVGDGGDTTIEGLDSAEYAQQLIRFPWRQVFGDVDNERISVVFTPTVGFARQAETFSDFDFETVQIADTRGVIRNGGV